MDLTEQIEKTKKISQRWPKNKEVRNTLEELVEYQKMVEVG